LIRLAILLSLSLSSSWLSVSGATAAEPAADHPTKGFRRWRVELSPSVTDAEYVAQHSALLINDAGSVYSVKPDGSGKKLLPGDGLTPSWTPDGRIIFSSSRSGSPQIWVMDRDGAKARQIGNVTAGAPLMPQMARDGTIAFMLIDDHSEANAGIWVMREDGSGMREIARGTQPSLAASGTWISYTYETDDPYHREIWRVNTDGTGMRQLTFLGDPDYPDANASNISPDEKWIAIFSGKEADRGDAGRIQDPATWGHRNVAIVPADGGPRRVLTPCKPLPEASPSDCIAADNPAWTPDSAWLVFDTDKPGVWLIDIEGRRMQRLYQTGRGPVRVPIRFE
jgi:Tol biopolymer transport system component